MGLGRSLNCLSLGHVIRNCAFPSKCRKCGPKFHTKHAGALHESFVPVSSVAGGVAKSEQVVTDGEIEVGGTSSDGDRPRTVLKIVPEIANTNVLLRTSAVRVINPRTGNSTLVYAQHDTASQATLISHKLVNELDLNVNTDHALNSRTLAEQTTKSAEFTELKLQSLATNQVFEIKYALVVSNFMDEEGALPHSVNVRNLNQ